MNGADNHHRNAAYRRLSAQARRRHTPHDSPLDTRSKRHRTYCVYLQIQESHRRLLLQQIGQLHRYLGYRPCSSLPRTCPLLVCQTAIPFLRGLVRLLVVAGARRLFHSMGLPQIALRHPLLGIHPGLWFHHPAPIWHFQSAGPHLYVLPRCQHPVAQDPRGQTAHPLVVYDDGPHRLRLLLHRQYYAYLLDLNAGDLCVH